MQQLVLSLIFRILTCATVGTAIDQPIDRLAGQDDSNPFGGNSTDGTFDENATLSQQQAVDLKKAVQSSIAAGLNVLSDV